MTKHHLTAFLISLLLIPGFSISQSARLVTPNWDHEHVNSIEFSSDNRYEMTVSEQAVFIWELASKKLVYTFEIDGINASFSRDGKQLVYGYQGIINIVDLQKGTIARQSMFPNKNIRWMTKFSNKGKILLAGIQYPDYTISLLSYPGGKLLKTIPGEIDQTEFSKDDKFLVTKKQKKIYKWNLETFEPVDSFSIDEYFNLFRISPGAGYIITTDSRKLNLWDIGLKKKRAEINDHKMYIRGVKFSDDATRMISYSYDSTCYAYNVITGEKLAEIRYTESQFGYSNACSLSPDGKRIAIPLNKKVFIYDISTRRMSDSFPSVSTYDVAVPMEFSNDGRTLSRIDSSGLVFYSLKEKKYALAPFVIDPIENVIFSPDQNYILSYSFDTAILWDRKTIKPLARMATNRAGFDCAFSEEGKRLMMWDGKDFTVFSIPEGRKTGEINNHISKIRGAKMDGNRIVISSNWNLMVYDAATNKKISEIPGTFGVTAASCTFNKEGTILLVSGKDSLLICSTSDGKIINKIFKGASDSSFHYIYISPGDKYIMTHDINHRHASVFDRSSGKRLFSLAVNFPRFSNDGNHILSGKSAYEIQNGREVTLLPVMRTADTWSNQFALSYPKNEILKKNTVTITDTRTNISFHLVLLKNRDWLLYDDNGWYDGTEYALSLVSIACGGKSVSEWKLIYPLWVVALAEKLMTGKIIEAKKLGESYICSD